jgi:hypothetical protein
MMTLFRRTVLLMLNNLKVTPPQRLPTMLSPARVVSAGADQFAAMGGRRRTAGCDAGDRRFIWRSVLPACLRSLAHHDRWFGHQLVPQSPRCGCTPERGDGCFVHWGCRARSHFLAGLHSRCGRSGHLTMRMQIEIPAHFCAKFRQSANRPHLLIGCEPTAIALALIVSVIIGYSFR